MEVSKLELSSLLPAWEPSFERAITKDAWDSTIKEALVSIDKMRKLARAIIDADQPGVLLDIFVEEQDRATAGMSMLYKAIAHINPLTIARRIGLAGGLLLLGIASVLTGGDTSDLI